PDEARVWSTGSTCGYPRHGNGTNRSGSLRPWPACPNASRETLMTAYVFTGPTLSVEEARAGLDAVYLPPVSQGDVYRVGLLRPEAIGIIDGYFDQVPAVWHKEILWAMTHG